MQTMLLTAPLLLPLLAGLALLFLHFPGARVRNGFILACVTATSLLLGALIFVRPAGTLTLLYITSDFPIALRIDGLSCVFCGLIAFLWPLASLYAFEYMEHEHGRQNFFTFYVFSYSATIGVALSANLITLYLFYELLTFATLPLVMHGMEKRATSAGVKYTAYSVGGATLSLIGILFLYQYGGPIGFAYGGHLTAESANRPLLLAGYFLTFLGFGVKSAIFPLHGWLPTAGVAPTPVTALLHAVAVVKAGVFAVIRSTFYSFGPEFLRGSWVQDAAMALAVFTIFYGSATALAEQHIKRRLAYSTISNLSYILFGVTLMSADGLCAALCHMVFHGVIKITLFFCAGAIICRTGEEYVQRMDGFGRKMPVTFGVFTFASAALCGVPLLPGFLSKFRLLGAAVAEGSAPALAGCCALVISAALTAGYLFPVAVRAFFPRKKAEPSALTARCDPGWRMQAPFYILCAAMLYLGMFSGPLTDTLARIASGAL